MSFAKPIPASAVRTAVAVSCHGNGRMSRAREVFQYSAFGRSKRVGEAGATTITRSIPLHSAWEG